MDKIIVNRHLYIFEKEPYIIEDDLTDIDIVYVPIDSLQGYQEFNEGKPIEGYNYNVKRITRPEYLECENLTIHTTNQTINYVEFLDGMFAKNVILDGKKIFEGNNMLYFPFDLNKQDLIMMGGDNYSLLFNTDLYLKDEGNVMRLIGDKFEYEYVKANTPFLFVSKIYNDNLIFHNKTFVYDGDKRKGFEVKTNSDTNFFMFGIPHLQSKPISPYTKPNTYTYYTSSGQTKRTKSMGGGNAFTAFIEERIR